MPLNDNVVVYLDPERETPLATALYYFRQGLLVMAKDRFTALVLKDRTLNEIAELAEEGIIISPSPLVSDPLSGA